MAHMQSLTRRVGELHQRIELGLGVVIGGGKGVLGFPDILPFLFHCGKIVFHKNHSSLPVCPKALVGLDYC